MGSKASESRYEAILPRKEEMVRSEGQDAAKKERNLERRCQKYGITPEFYNRLGESQGWRCACCGRHQNEFSTSLNIDHEHFTVDSYRSPNAAAKWSATARFKDGRSLTEVGPTKAAAVAAVRLQALPASVRGLLCPGRYRGCNRLLGHVDNIRLLESFVAYLKNPPARQILAANLPLTTPIICDSLRKDEYD